MWFHALTSGDLFRVPVPALADPTLTEPQRAGRVEKMARLGLLGGLVFVPAGHLLATSVERGSVECLNSSAGEWMSLATHPALS